LIPIEVVELGELSWRLKFEDDGPMLLVNRSLFANASAAEQDPAFVAFVLPEALRQVCIRMGESPEEIDDEAGWHAEWADWLVQLGLTIPPPSTDSALAIWVDQAVERFCESHMFCRSLLLQRAPAGGK